MKFVFACLSVKPVASRPLEGPCVSRIGDFDGLQNTTGCCYTFALSYPVIVFNRMLHQDNILPRTKPALLVVFVFVDVMQASVERCLR